jgi:hypothetical protein
MDLSELSKLASDQDAGHWWDLLHPTNGDPVGIRVKLVGPDSDKARKARFRMEREFTKLQNRKNGGTPEGREELMISFLFELVLEWEVKEAGQVLPLTRENFTRLLKAGTWVRSQIDAFAGDRSPYFDEDEKPASAPTREGGTDA